jgi:predicted transcriptional regulator
MAKKSARKRSISDELRAAIRKTGLTHYRIGKNAGVTADMVDRFVYGDRDPQLSTAEKIAKGAGYRLVLEPLDEE